MKVYSYNFQTYIFQQFIEFYELNWILNIGPILFIPQPAKCFNTFLPFVSIRAADKEGNDVTGDIEMGPAQRYEPLESNTVDELPTLDDLIKSEPTIKVAQHSHAVTRDADNDPESFVRVSSETLTINQTNQSVAGKNVHCCRR